DAGHGTPVLGQIIGTGAVHSRYRGVAPGVGVLWVGKIWGADGQGAESWIESGMDFLAGTSCGSFPTPQLINLSGGLGGIAQTGTDSLSRKLDDKVWTSRQAYVVCSGNSGPSGHTIRSPLVAKDVLTAGIVIKYE